MLLLQISSIVWFITCAISTAFYFFTWFMVFATRKERPDLLTLFFCLWLIVFGGIGCVSLMRESVKDMLLTFS